VAVVGNEGWVKGTGGANSSMMGIVASIENGERRRPTAATGQHPRQ